MGIYSDDSSDEEFEFGQDTSSSEAAEDDSSGSVSDDNASVSVSDYNDDGISLVSENDNPNNAATGTTTTTTNKTSIKKKKAKSSSIEPSSSPPTRQPPRAKTTSTMTAAPTATAEHVPKKSNKTIEETYQKKTQLEHILLRPDTYIGSVEPLTQPMFVHDDETGRIIQREITYTPGFYKIFDEIVVNAADNKQRDPTMDRLEIDLDAERGIISVLNNGKSIPVVKHKEHGCYVATLIFGHLLTGSNFDDDEKKTTGGRNGYGAKLANIFSRKFMVECLDASRGLKFTQVWRNNMHKAEEPVVDTISSSEKKNGDYVKITFLPDFDKLNMTAGLDDDAIGLISKRAYDIAGSMSDRKGKKLNVYLNGEKLKVHDFKSYLALFDGVSTPEVIEKIGNDWEVGVGCNMDGGGFQQISFVNAIATTKGGGHVDYITNLLVKHLQATVAKKNKGSKDMKPAQIKNHLSVFINCLVENPTFDSQTKENLTTKPTNFKTKALSNQFMKRVEKCGVVESIMQFAKFQESRALQRKGGTKKSKLRGISKLDDANHAGTSKSKDCTLIITEGDSAKSLAMAGLSVVGRDYYGVFPLKGKLLNVRDATHAQIMKNEEIMNLVEIMGLKFNSTYTEENVKSLRYGHLMIMADQDHDGSHIKGLVINFIHHFWPSLLDVPGFLQQFITPIVKCTKGKHSKTFYTLPQYEEWRESTGNTGKGWHIKYYKGLGTSTSAEAKDYFSALDVHEIHFNELSSDIAPNYNSDDEIDIDECNNTPTSSGANLIDMAFSKSKADERKEWLRNANKNVFLNYTDAQKNGINYSDFVNKELALFSLHNVQRSLPHILDGLKISQRKVLFGCFKKKLKNEIKVAQLAGYVGEHSAYHHGEISLHGAIVGMAQNYVGSNNVNLLYPSGQFGTRRMGGKDHASARYIFTRLEQITRAIFHPDDDALLTYLNEDGSMIEPEHYMPVIPMLLVNGAEGIGTGWSSSIKSHNPREIISNIRKMIRNEVPDEMHPYFFGWTGEITSEAGKDRSYTVRGEIKRMNTTTLHITELPIGRWTQDYKENVLEKMLTGNDDKKKKKKDGNEDDGKQEGDIIDFKEHHTDTNVSFTISSSQENIDAFEKEKDGLHGKFKLIANISTKNMTAFDKDGKLKTYKDSLEILTEFFRHRMAFYVARKDMLLQKMRSQLSMLENKTRFVEEVCDGALIVTDRKRTELLVELKKRGYAPFQDDAEEASDKELDSLEEESNSEENMPDNDLSKGYEYLLGMKIWSLTFERAEEIRVQRGQKIKEVESLDATPPENIWLADLDAIERILDERDKALGIDSKRQKRIQAVNRTNLPKNAGRKRKEKAPVDEWDSERSEPEESDTADSQSEDDTDDIQLVEKSTTRRNVKVNSANSVKSVEKVEIPSTYKSPTNSKELTKRKKHNRFHDKIRDEDEVMTFTVDSLTSQWDSDDSEREESNHSDSRLKNVIYDAHLHSTKVADAMTAPKRGSGLSAKKSYGRSHADRYAKKSKSSRNTGSSSKGKTVISLGSRGISPKFSFGTKTKSHEALFECNSRGLVKTHRQVDDLLVDSDSVSIVRAKSDSSAINTTRKRVLETSSESDGSPQKRKRVLESDSEDDEF